MILLGLVVEFRAGELECVVCGGCTWSEVQ